MVGWRPAALLAILLYSAAPPARAADDTLPSPVSPSQAATRAAAQTPSAERATADLATLGPLSGTIPLGATGRWTVSVDEGRLIVSGSGGTDEVWTAFPPFGRDRAAGIQGTVRVEAEGAAAGLAFDLAPDVDGFLAWVSTGDGKVALLRKIKGIVTRVSTYDIPGGRREAGDLLQVQQNAGGARLLVNGRLVTSLSWADEPDLNGDGAFGIVAIGPGRQTFRSFAVGDAPQGAFATPVAERPANAPAASPAPAVPAAAAASPPAAPPSDAQRLASLGPLAGQIGLGTSGAWTAGANQGRLVLANPAKPGAVRSYEMAWQGNAAKGRSVGVRVKVDGKDPNAAAGLILRLSEGAPHWLAWVATADGRYALYSRDEQGLHVINADNIPGGLRADGNLLQVSQEGDRIAVFIDGTFLAKSPAGGKAPTAGAPVGVLAMGEGTFTIGDFAFGPALATAEASTPVPPQPAPAKAGQDDTVPPPMPDPAPVAQAGGAAPPQPVPAPKAEGPTPPKPAPVARDARRDVPELGPLGKDVELGTRGPWTEAVEGNRYTVSNATDNESIDNFTIAWQGSRKPGRSFSARVEVPPDSGSAGLVFGYDGTSERSILFIVTQDRKASVVALRKGKADGIATLTIDGVRPPEGDLLSITQTEAGTVLRADGKVVATLSPNDGRGLDETGGVGIAALGIGRYAFHAVAFGSGSPSPAAGDAGNPAVPQSPAKAEPENPAPHPAPVAQAGGSAPQQPVPAAPKADGSAPPKPEPAPTPPGRDARRDVPELGPIGKDVQLGSHGPWTSTVEGGRYILSNATDDDSVDNFTTAWQGSRTSGRSLSARVEVPPGGGSAGLVFGYDGTSDRSILFIVTPDRKASVVSLRKGKADAVATLTLDGTRPAEGDLLSITQAEAGTVLRADGEVVATLSPNDGRNLDETGGVGIAALGIGRYAFHAVAFGSTAPSPAAGDAGNPAVPKLPKFKAGGQLTRFTAETFGATLGILSHEFGHFMIGELKIPATGPEEDVADEFAAMVFVDNIRNEPQSAVGPAVGAAKFWWFEAEEHGDNATPWYDEHAPDRARFAKFMCMLYGADARDFGPVMDAAGIPERSKQRCLADEPKRQRAWTTLLRPYRRAGIDPIEVGDLDPATPGHKITVEYRPSKNPALQPFAEEIRKSGVFDYLAAYVSAVYVLPRDTKIVFKDCGIMNCWYQENTGDVTMCWEMIGSVLGTFRKHEPGATQAGDGQPGQGGTAPLPAPPAPPVNPTPPAAGKEVTLAQFMQGRWHSQIRSAQGPQEGFFELDAQGRYTARIRSDTANGPFVLSVEGTWSVAPEGGTHVRLVLSPSNWSPRQFCQQQGYCSPINLQLQTSEIEIIDRDTLRSAVGESKRMR